MNSQQPSFAVCLCWFVLFPSDFRAKQWLFTVYGQGCKSLLSQSQKDPNSGLRMCSCNAHWHFHAGQPSLEHAQSHEKKKKNWTAKPSSLTWIPQGPSLSDCVTQCPYNKSDQSQLKRDQPDWWKKKTPGPHCNSTLATNYMANSAR